MSVITPSISLRDYFASSAMKAMLCGLFIRGESKSPDELMERFENIHRNAYWHADALLKARQNQNDNG